MFLINSLAYFIICQNILNLQHSQKIDLIMVSTNRSYIYLKLLTLFKKPYSACATLKIFYSQW